MKADDLPKPEKFVDSITADHAILADKDESRHGDRVALIIQDRHTNWLQAYAGKQKSAEETARAFQRFLGPQVVPEHVYTDGSLEFSAAMQQLGFSHDSVVPHRPQTNGVAERAVRRVKEGTSAVLIQSGFSTDWWAEAMNCYCFLRTIVDKGANSFTAYENRFTTKFEGPVIPMGVEVNYMLISAKDKARTHKFGDKLLNGIFVGYGQHAGGRWDKTLLLVDWEELQTHQTAAQVRIKRFKAGEVHPMKVAGVSGFRS